MATTEGGAEDALILTPPPTAEAAKQTWKGRAVKRFRLIDLLGEGAMGRVFVAEDTVIRRHVALKLLPAKHRDGRPNHRTERLVREARSAASLEHPNAVTIYEIDQVGNVHYIAMELVEGGNLERLVQKSGPMEIERACQLIAEAAEVIAHAHARGIIHRDIKPANLLLTRNGRCKVADFGLACFDSSEDESARARCVGTPHFIAPEIAVGRGATEASDIYSLGCTLWFLLTGRPPFTGSNAREVLKAHVTTPLPDVRRWRPDAPERLWSALEQACAKEPSDRFPDAEHFAKVLRTLTIPTGGSSGNHPPLSSATQVSGLAMSSQTGQFQPLAPAMSGAIPPSDMQMPIVAGRSAGMSALIYAGIGTVAATFLIGAGVWLSHRGGQPSESVAAFTPASTTPPPSTPTPLAIAHSAPAPIPSPVLSSPSPAAIVHSKTPAPTPVRAAKILPAQPVVGDVARNGTMEASDSDFGLAGWFVRDKFRSQVQMVTEAGNRFVRLTNDDFDKTVFIDQTIAIDPSWKSITISARMRATRFKAGKLRGQDARVRYIFRDKDDNRLGDWPTVPNLRKSSPWTTRTVNADVPAGSKTIYIQLAIFNATGIVDFDDVHVIPGK